LKNGSKHLAIAGGGTGGHIFPALAIAKAVMNVRPEIKLTYLGKATGPEARLARQNDIRFYDIPARPLARKLSLSNLMIPFTLWRGSSRTVKLIRKEGIGALIGTGGYVSVPALMGAKRAKIAIFLQEQNSYPGIATRLYAKHASRLFIASSKAKKYLSAESNFHQVGNPLRSDFKLLSREDGLDYFDLSPDKRTLLVFGGSQGAQALNDKIAENLPFLAKQGNLQMIWQAGKNNFNIYRHAFEASGIQGVVLEFIERMDLAYASADLAFCRSGALSLAELAACGLPAILVPYPWAAEDHQYHNAREYADSGAAIVVKQSELSGFDLVRTVGDLLFDRAKLEQMKKAAVSMADLEAADKIAAEIIEVMKW
jgi:UDP-N-acetylglucosamine--N-acetylmuramyl-(pentapeptide) pyrophosphoryl-undecaprenol N-acetylglucosamine transferase